MKFNIPVKANIDLTKFIKKDDPLYELIKPFNDMKISPDVDIEFWLFGYKISIDIH